MATMDMTMRKKLGFTVVLASVTVFSSVATGAEFEPAISLGVTHTDNVANSADDPLDENIFRVEPAIRFVHESKSLDVNLDYLMQALQYDDLDEDDIFHQGFFTARGNVLEEQAYLEIGAERAQTLVDPELDIPIGNLPLSANRQDRDSYYVRPGFDFRLSPTVSAIGSYEYSRVENSAEQLAGADADLGIAEFTLNNYQDGDGVTWALRYFWRRAVYDSFDPFENQRATAELGFWATSSTRVFTTFGMESAWDEPLEPGLEDSLWEVGFAYQAGERLQAEFAAGERSFGTSYRGDLDWSFRRGSMSFSYSQLPTTQAMEQFRQGDLFDPTGIDDLLIRPGEAQRFIANNLEWTLQLEFSRLQVSFSAFSFDRTDRTNADGTQRPDESTRGLNASLDYRIGARTSMQLGARTSNLDLENEIDRDINWYNAGFNYRLGRRTSVWLSYQYVEEGAGGGLDGGAYESNSVTMMLRWGAEGSESVRPLY